MSEEVKIITPDEVSDKLQKGEKLYLVDIREDEEVVQGKIPEAIHIRMGEIPERLDEFDNEKEYILVCRSGNRSHHASLYLQSLGYKVRNMVGGMLEWPGQIR